VFIGFQRTASKREVRTIPELEQYRLSVTEYSESIITMELVPSGEPGAGVSGMLQHVSITRCTNCAAY